MHSTHESNSQTETSAFDLIYQAALAQNEDQLKEALKIASIDVLNNSGPCAVFTLARQKKMEAVAFLLKFNASLIEAAYGFARGGHVQEVNQILNQISSTTHLCDHELKAVAHCFRIGGYITEEGTILSKCSLSHEDLTAYRNTQEMLYLAYKKQSSKDLFEKIRQLPPTHARIALNKAITGYCNYAYLEEIYQFLDLVKKIFPDHLTNLLKHTTFELARKNFVKEAQQFIKHFSQQENLLYPSLAEGLAYSSNHAQLSLMIQEFKTSIIYVSILRRAIEGYAKAGQTQKIMLLLNEPEIKHNLKSEEIFLHFFLTLHIQPTLLAFFYDYICLEHYSLIPIPDSVRIAMVDALCDSKSIREAYKFLEKTKTESPTSVVKLLKRMLEVFVYLGWDNEVNNVVHIIKTEYPDPASINALVEHMAHGYIIAENNKKFHLFLHKTKKENPELFLIALKAMIESRVNNEGIQATLTFLKEIKEKYADFFQDTSKLPAEEQDEFKKQFPTSHNGIFNYIELLTHTAKQFVIHDHPAEAHKILNQVINLGHTLQSYDTLEVITRAEHKNPPSTDKTVVLNAIAMLGMDGYHGKIMAIDYNIFDYNVESLFPKARKMHDFINKHKLKYNQFLSWNQPDWDLPFFLLQFSQAKYFKDRGIPISIFLHQILPFFTPLPLVGDEPESLLKKVSTCVGLGLFERRKEIEAKEDDENRSAKRQKI